MFLKLRVSRQNPFLQKFTYGREMGQHMHRKCPLVVLFYWTPKGVGDQEAKW